MSSNPSSVHSESNTESPTAKIHTRPWAATLILTGGILLLLLGMALSISFGAADIQLGVVWKAVFNFNPDLTPHQIIWEIRLPRVLGGAMVGACFAVAGAIMQGMTRNPLADSGLLGLNAGAGFALAICFAFSQACHICTSLCIHSSAQGLACCLYMASVQPPDQA